LFNVQIQFLLKIQSSSCFASFAFFNILTFLLAAPPDFFDISGRKDGQCGDMGQQWIIQINQSELIKKLGLKIQATIAPTIYHGESETHFCKPGNTHVWNGIAILDKQGNIVDEIYIDASFQNIMTKKESGYNQRKSFCEITNIRRNKNTTIRIGKIKINGTQWESNFFSGPFLGVSQNYKYAYAITFCRDSQDDVIRPLLKRVFQNGDFDCHVINKNGRPLISEGHTTTPSEKEEIERILSEAQKIKFIEKQPTIHSLSWTKSDTSS